MCIGLCCAIPATKVQCLIALRFGVLRKAHFIGVTAGLLVWPFDASEVAQCVGGLLLLGVGCVQGRVLWVGSADKGSYLVDPASSHMLVSKIKPCMSKYKRFCTVKLRMAH